jgi:calcium uniporter protein, mitochondrial
MIVGYLWFLYHNRDVSYRSVFQQTTTRRQNLLYQKNGFDEDQWNELVAEGKKLGREIKAIGEQYGVKWNPKVEATGRAEGVLEKEDKKDKRAKKAREKEKDEDEEDD